MKLAKPYQVKLGAIWDAWDVGMIPRLDVSRVSGEDVVNVERHTDHR